MPGRIKPNHCFSDFDNLEENSFDHSCYWEKVPVETSSAPFNITNRFCKAWMISEVMEWNGIILSV